MPFLGYNLSVGYFKNAAKGISWMGLLRASTRAIAFLRIAILARLLTPDQFGIYGVGSLILAFLEVITETGVNIVLIQSRKKLVHYLDTAWVVSIFRGILISCLMILVSYPVSLFFGSPASLNVILFLSLVPFLRGFINPMIVSFQKELDFKKEFLLRFSVFSFDASLAIIFAFLTKSVLSLAIGLIGSALLEVFLSFYFLKPTPKFKFEKEKIKFIVARGKWLTFAGIFNYLFEEGDDWVVGRIMGTQSLGIYQVAYKVSSLPVYEVGQVFNKVTFPVYNLIKDDKERLKKAFYKVTLTISALVVPFGLILFFFTDPLVRIVLGEKWLSAVPVIKVLSIFGIVRSIASSAHSLYLGVDKQEYSTMVTLVGILGLGLTIVPLVIKFGIVGAGFSALFGTLVSLPLVFYYLAKVFKEK